MTVGPIGARLQQAGLISKNIRHHVHFHYGVRDNPTTIVKRCAKTDVIFLHDIYKSNNPNHARLSIEDSAKTPDNIRRTLQFRKYIEDRTWADIGAGSGGLLLNNHKLAKYAVGVEPLYNLRKHYPCDATSDINELENNSYDTITMIHTLEHILDFENALKQVKNKMKPGGFLIIEVPHSRDYLLRSCEEARISLLWTQHYVLHTAQSLIKLLEHIGFEIQINKYIQRYPLSNHMFWALDGQPNGHKILSQINNSVLNIAYEEALTKLKMTDTLICYANKPKKS